MEGSKKIDIMDLTKKLVTANRTLLTGHYILGGYDDKGNPVIATDLWVSEIKLPKGYAYNREGIINTDIENSDFIRVVRAEKFVW